MSSHLAFAKDGSGVGAVVCWKTPPGHTLGTLSTMCFGGVPKKEKTFSGSQL